MKLIVIDVIKSGSRELVINDYCNEECEIRLTISGCNEYVHPGTNLNITVCGQNFLGTIDESGAVTQNKFKEVALIEEPKKVITSYWYEIILSKVD